MDIFMFGDAPWGIRVYPVNPVKKENSYTSKLTVQPLSKMNVIPTEGRNLYLAPVSERFLAALEMTKNLNCYPAS
ncbi:MAG: hypothetical protein A3G93_00645 [Nitrospinae bacterium RIFCSPLOWO2_12_FULL_45_22]|nr:MAG: hypothetical protein A3G93_00645 [Nitrospinae bacterium RIFCSPLOWO2_12_FULL_45_22]